MKKKKREVLPAVKKGEMLGWGVQKSVKAKGASTPPVTGDQETLYEKNCKKGEHDFERKKAQGCNGNHFHGAIITGKTRWDANLSEVKRNQDVHQEGA